MSPLASVPDAVNSAARSRVTSWPQPNPSAYTVVLPITWLAMAYALFAAVEGRQLSCTAVSPSKDTQI